MLFSITRILFILLFVAKLLHAKQDFMEERTFWEWNYQSTSYNVHFVEKGTGDRHLFLIHGFGSHIYTWHHLIDKFAEAGFHVWSLDLIGFGYSEKPLKIPYGLHLFVSQIEDFMKAKSISSADFVGNSMGGGVALAMAVEHLNRVKSLTLIDPLAFPIQLPYYYDIPKKLGKLTFPFIGRTTVKMILKNLVFDSNKITEDQITAYTSPLLMKGGKEAFLKILQNMDMRELDHLSLRYREINVPLLLIWGEQDRLIPITYLKRLTQIFPKAKTLVISNCGHIPQEECPQEVLKGMLNFLQLLPHKSPR